MSIVERWFCRTSPWQSFTSRVILPWALRDAHLGGEVLEIGAGGGAMAEAMLHRFGDVHVTATDIDASMVKACRERLREHPRLRAVEVADVTALPYATGSFDVVTSYLMLHHVVDWPRALEEVARVLRPGGVLMGYDLTETTLSHLVHRLDRSPYRLLTAEQLREGLRTVGFGAAQVDQRLAGHVMRFRATTG